MQRDLEALEVVCTHYRAHHASEALRKEKNRVRNLQRKVVKLECEVSSLRKINDYCRLRMKQISEKIAGLYALIMI